MRPKNLRGGPRLFGNPATSLPSKMYVERKENTSSHALSPLTTMFGRNLVIETGIGSSSFSASKDASLVIR